MSYMYKLNETKVKDEDGIIRIVYGIDVVDEKENIIKSFTNIFFKRSKAESFVALCNECKLSLIHLADVVEDARCE